MENKVIVIHELHVEYVEFMYNADFILHFFINDKTINPPNIRGIRIWMLKSRSEWRFLEL